MRRMKPIAVGLRGEIGSSMGKRGTGRTFGRGKAVLVDEVRADKGPGPSEARLAVNSNDTCTSRAISNQDRGRRTGRERTSSLDRSVAQLDELARHL